MSALIPVTNIALSPDPDITQLTVGRETTFTATIEPPNATNQSVIWARVSGVNCTISQNAGGSQVTLNPNEDGSVKIRAAIINGKAQ